jgi:hypothetical protein
MPPLRQFILAALLLALAAAVRADAQVLYGRVVDAADGSPVAAAQVLALDASGTVASAVSGRDGRYELALPSAGAGRLQVSRFGFRTGISPVLQVGEGERMGADLSLRPEAVRLEGVEARSRATPDFHDRRARGFYDRMDRGRGRYLTPERVESMRAGTPSGMLWTVPGVSFSSGMVSSGLRLGTTRARSCVPDVYLDGHRIHPYPGWRLDDHVAAREVWAIEVYMDAGDIPPELPREGRGNCGIVMIWTHTS